MAKIYLDKHGEAIQPGMTIRHDNGETDEVFATVDAYGEDDMGVLASNPAYLERHPEADIEYYSLSNFDMSEWEIVHIEK